MVSADFLNKVLSTIEDFNEKSQRLCEEVGINPRLLDDEKTGSKTHREEIEELLSNFFFNFSDSYQKSVLKGEHYFKVTEEINLEIDKEIQGLKNSLDSLDGVFKSSSQSALLANVMRECQSFNNLYQRLCHFAQTNSEIDSTKKHIVVDFEAIVTKSSLESTFDSVKYTKNERPLLINFGVFQVNVLLEYIDDTLGAGIGSISELYYLKQLLSGTQFKASEAAKILLEKCNFLIEKVRLRLELDDYNENIFDDYKYPLEQSIALIDTSFIYYKQLNIQSKLISRILANKAINENDIKSEISKYSELRESEVNNKFLYTYILSELYLKLAKTGKEKNIIGLVNEATQGIQNLKSRLRSDCFKIKKSDLLFEAKSFETTEIYLENQELAILVRKTDVEFNNLKNKLKANKDIALVNSINKIKSSFKNYFRAIEDKQNKQLKNYFPYLQVCKFNIQLIVFLNDIYIYSKEDEGAEISEMIKKTIKSFRKYLRILRENIIWCKKIGYLQLYFPYEECISKFKPEGEEEEVVVFIDSSSLLPINFEKIDKDINKLVEVFNDTRVFIMNTIIDNSKKSVKVQLTNQGTLIDDKITAFNAAFVEDFEKRSHSQNIKNIEILSLFAIIIAFVFGSISVIPKFTDFRCILTFMIGFSFALSGFVVTLHLIVSDKLSKKIWYFLAAFLVLIVIDIIVLKNCNCQISQDPENSKIENNINAFNSHSQILKDTSHSTNLKLPLNKKLADSARKK